MGLCSSKSIDCINQTETERKALLSYSFTSSWRERQKISRTLAILSREKLDLASSEREEIRDFLELAEEIKVNTAQMEDKNLTELEREKLAEKVYQLACDAKIILLQLKRKELIS